MQYTPDEASASSYRTGLLILLDHLQVQTHLAQYFMQTLVAHSIQTHLCFTPAANEIRNCCSMMTKVFVAGDIQDGRNGHEDAG